MSWNAELTSNKDITFNEVEKIVDELPDDLVIEFLLREGKVPFCGWGWNAVTDIKVPNGNKLTISGSYSISGNKAEHMANFLKDKLEENGHSVKVKFYW